ncbi:unnamed protein product [Lymnaea stagnalis]|uniref:Antistasin-like domain-containing protein n=1 Tax=Lymnaea stagnalis TaxID=6523 RepID=A0AAV2HQL5_LYMST
MWSSSLLLLMVALAVVSGSSTRTAPIRCMLHCDIGRGLVLSPSRCSCAPINGTGTSVTCPHVYCPLGSCDVFKTDALGCPTCQCECPNTKLPCPTVGCRFGSRLVTDDNGCRKCECRHSRRNRRAMSVPRRCPMRCAIRCAGGQVFDKHGCPMCRCKRPGL